MMAGNPYALYHVTFLTLDNGNPVALAQTVSVSRISAVTRQGLVLMMVDRNARFRSAILRVAS
jgi:hypothetical protein